MTMTNARSIRVRGVVQGVGFRPFVYRLARENALTGWVLNETEGVEIHLEGAGERLDAFVRRLRAEAPPAAGITTIDIREAAADGLDTFTIRDSRAGDQPVARISPDLAVCDRCLTELFDPADPRYRYPYINCTDCGPRYSIITSLPYDRASTTMAGWRMDAACAADYHDPLTRRFHAQPVACESCGPRYVLRHDGEATPVNVVRRAAKMLRDGRILAVKGIGGYHLACDARRAEVVSALRERKYRKEKPFALMVRDLASARRLAAISPADAALLTSAARPIVLVPRLVDLPGVAPESGSFGIMLPYTPLHHLLFEAGAPDPMVMTSANRSSEPIAYEDADALTRLAGLADAFLVGERPIARRVEDSVVRAGTLGPVVLRRARGYAPGAVAELPPGPPILALGADLKNAITLVIDGQAFVTQFIGDLEHAESARAFRETIDDLLRMYAVRRSQMVVVHDAHPEYCSTRYAPELGAASTIRVQHHRAHIASVLAERGEWERQVLGVALDGTGYGDDGTIWGGEICIGSVAHGFVRRAHLRRATLVGGDAAARHPVQAAVGFLDQLEDLPDLRAEPFRLGLRYDNASKVLASGTRCFATTSMGRLFDCAAALAGFTRPVTYEGQAAIWLEEMANNESSVNGYPFPFTNGELDFRPLLQGMVHDRARGRSPGEISAAFHAGVARGLATAVIGLSAMAGIDTIVVSGGVFQNELLVAELVPLLRAADLTVWANHLVPPNDGGISLGQAAIAACGPGA